MKDNKKDDKHDIKKKEKWGLKIEKKGGKEDDIQQKVEAVNKKKKTQSRKRDTREPHSHEITSPYPVPC